MAGPYQGWHLAPTLPLVEIKCSTNRTMNSRNTAPFLLAALILSLTAGAARAQRQVMDLAKDWKFIKQDAGPSASTADWESVTVPHTWNNLDAQKGVLGNPGIKGGYFRGACWYERALDVPADWKGKRVFVRFEAASIVAQVYLNGELIGEHRGAFTAFCCELTPHLHPGKANELRVRVDNSQQEDVPPLSGDFNMDGGLYRPVELIVTDAICVTPLDYASPGVFETIKSLDDQHASVQIESLISNGESTEQSAHVETVIKNADGAIVAQHTQTQTIPAAHMVPTTEQMEIATPHRWNGRKDPYLYSVTVTIRRGDDAVDEVVQPLGLRTVAITREEGFLLNSKPYPIHGVCRHQDHFDQGWALSTADHQQDADLILDMGATAVRNTHYPQSGTWHDLADHNGLLMWNEVSLVNTVRDTPEFAANAELEARELILQLYNHPSIAFWGLFNELGNTKGMPSPDALLMKLKAEVHELDASRLIVAASDHQKKSYNLIPDWTCYNTYPGWYGGSPTSLAATIASFSKEIGKRIALSEYGAGGNPFQHEEGPIHWEGNKIAKSAFHPEEYQDAVHEADYSQIVDNPDLWGSFIWVMFDFPAAPRHEGGTTGLNDKGMVTQDRKTKKDVYFFYQANWTEAPMVYIASRRMTPRTMATTEIKVYSNCPSVELKINGKTIQTVQPNNVHVFHWENVTLKPGENQVEATGTSDGKTVNDHCTWVLQPGAAPAPVQ
jgi:beta-galactosidase